MDSDMGGELSQILLRDGNGAFMSRGREVSSLKS